MRPWSAARKKSMDGWRHGDICPALFLRRLCRLFFPVGKRRRNPVDQTNDRSAEESIKYDDQEKQSHPERSIPQKHLLFEECVSNPGNRRNVCAINEMFQSVSRRSEDRPEHCDRQLCQQQENDTEIPGQQRPEYSAVHV